MKAVIRRNWLINSVGNWNSLHVALSFNEGVLNEINELPRFLLFFSLYYQQNLLLPSNQECS